MQISKIAFYTSLGLFAFSLVLPAVNLGPWLPGLNVFFLSFGGLVFSLHLGSPRHFAACLLGASANVLMLFAYLRIWKGRYSGAALASTTAMALMVLVLGPLNSMAAANAKGMVSFGYYFWVAAGFTLALSAWLHAWQMVKSAKQEGDRRTADRWRIISTVGAWLAILTIQVRNMKKVLVVIPLLILGLVVFGFMAFKIGRSVRDARCAAEAQAAVEQFLRAGGAASDPASLVHSFSGPPPTLPPVLGDFIRMEGSGYLYPAPFTDQGHFLDLRREARFQHATFPVRIIVVGGPGVVPGLREVGKPKVEHGIIYVYNPEVRKGW